MVISGRTALGRRLRDIADHLAAGLGGWAQLTELQAAAVRKGAELQALAEHARAARLKGDTSVTLDDVVRLDRLADQSVRRLGLDRERELAAPPDLKAYLAALPREPAGATRTPTAPSDNHAPSGDAPAPGSPFERVRVGDRVPLDDGREIEVIPDDDELEPSP
jgi:hypothetical protein